MSPALTRRSFTKAGAAALGTAVAGISVAAQAAAVDPDAALVALIASHGDAMAELNALDDASDPLRELFRTTGPARPDALSWRRSDFQRSSIGVGASDPIGDTKAREYGYRGVAWLRKFKTSADWPAASEARRREIVEAYDRWQAAHTAYADRIGLTGANDACDQQSDAVSDIEVAICGYVPMTLDGLRAKARWIASSPQADEWAAFLLRDLSGVAS